MNKIACDVSLETQKELSEFENSNIKIPLGNILKNNIIAQFAPKINIQVQPVGYIETSYASNFDSCGINQTRHRIYVKVKSKAKILMPFKSKTIEVINEMPISETIIVGNTPSTAIDLDLKGAGFKISSGK